MKLYPGWKVRQPIRLIDQLTQISDLSQCPTQFLQAPVDAVAPVIPSPRSQKVVIDTRFVDLKVLREQRGIIVE